MPQIFHRSFNTLSKVSIFGALILLAVLGWALYVVGWSPYVTQAHIARVQPVPFSHAHHGNSAAHGKIRGFHGRRHRRTRAA
jgi:hypothetical protein